VICHCQVTLLFHCSFCCIDFLGSVNQQEVKSHLVSILKGFGLLSLKCHVHRASSNFRKIKESRKK